MESNLRDNSFKKSVKSNKKIETDINDLIYISNYFKKNIDDIKYFSFEVDEKMSSKSNYRQDGIKNWKRIKEFEDYVSLRCKLEKNNDFIITKEEMGYAIIIESDSKIDVGNYSKSILDSLEGIIYNNDKEVDLIISRRLKSESKKERTIIHIFKVSK